MSCISDSNRFMSSLQFDDQHRYGRIIRPVCIFRQDHQIFMRIQLTDKRKHLIPFLISCIPATVNAKCHKSAFFQKLKSAFYRSYAAVCSGRHRMVSAGKISQIKGDAGHGFFFCINIHILMRLQKKLIIFRTVISFQSLLRMFQCLLLNVKSQNPSPFSCKLA